MVLFNKKNLGVLCYDEAPRESANWLKETGRCWESGRNEIRFVSLIHFPLVLFFFPGFIV